MAGKDAERELFVALKIIGKLKTHEKIATRGGVGLRIEANDKLQWLRRWYYGETRFHNVDTLVTILDAAFSQMRIRLEKPRSTTAADRAFFERVRKEFVVARQGLCNLAATYGDCTTTQARIEHLIDTLDAHTKMLADGDEAAKTAT